MRRRPFIINRSKSIGPLSCRCSLLAALVCFLGYFDFLLPASGAEKPAPKPQSANSQEGEIPKSAFVPAGKDPFFPDSGRLTKPEGSTVLTPKPVVKRDLFSYLKISGFIHGRRPQVDLNGTTFMQGDPPADVKILVPDAENRLMVQKIRVSCLEFRGKSVVVAIDGQPGTKELFWRE